MKTKLMMMACALMLAITTHAASKVTENRKHTGFQEIEIKGSPTVVYTQGNTFSVKVAGKKEGVADIITSVQGKRLVVRNKGKIGIFNITFGDSEQAVVYVTSPDLTGVTVSGSGDFISKSQVDTDKLRITLKGSGDIDFKDIICDVCHTELVGSGDIDIDRLDALEATVTLTGSGDVDVNFAGGSATATCTLRGSGDITLKGQLKKLTQQKTGSGDIDTSKLKIIR